MTLPKYANLSEWLPKFTYYIYPDSYAGFAGGGAAGIDLAAAVGEGGEVVAASDAAKAAAAKSKDESVAAAKQSAQPEARPGPLHLGRVSATTAR